MLSYLKLIWINAGIYSTLFCWTALSFILSPLYFLFFTKILKRGKPKTLRQMIWYYGWTCSKMMSLFVDINWPEQQELPRPCIVVANHESILDPYLPSFQPEKNVCMAVRNWPFKIPFYGFYMRMAGYINVETEDIDDIRTQALKALDEKATLMFFPEGTRSKNGELNRFHSGPFHIAVETGVPIVPLCLSGTYELLSRGRMIIRPSRVRAKILAPVHPDEYKNKQTAHIELRHAVKKIMVSCIQDLKEESRK